MAYHWQDTSTIVTASNDFRLISKKHKKTSITWFGLCLVELERAVTIVVEYHIFKFLLLFFVQMFIFWLFLWVGLFLWSSVFTIKVIKRISKCLCISSPTRSIFFLYEWNLISIICTKLLHILMLCRDKSIRFTSFSAKQVTLIYRCRFCFTFLRLTTYKTSY